MIQHGYPVAHGEGFVLVVGHVDEGDAHGALHVLELKLHFLAELEVERTERLVEQQHLRLVDDRPGQRYPLPLTAGQLRRPALAERGKPDPLHRAADLLTAFLPGTRRTRRPYSIFPATVICGNSA